MKRASTNEEAIRERLEKIEADPHEKKNLMDAGQAASAALGRQHIWDDRAALHVSNVLWQKAKREIRPFYVRLIIFDRSVNKMIDEDHEMMRITKMK